MWVVSQLSWPDADALCRQNKMKLVSIETKKENDWLVNQITLFGMTQKKTEIKWFYECKIDFLWSRLRRLRCRQWILDFRHWRISAKSESKKTLMDGNWYSIQLRLDTSHQFGREPISYILTSLGSWTNKMGSRLARLPCFQSCFRRTTWKLEFWHFGLSTSCHLRVASDMLLVFFSEVLVSFSCSLLVYTSVIYMTDMQKKCTMKAIHFEKLFLKWKKNTYLRIMGSYNAVMTKVAPIKI